MKGYISWGSLLKIIFVLVISFHCLHVVSEEEQQKQYQQLSSKPKEYASKPTWPEIPWPDPFPFPIGSKPDNKNDHEKEIEKPPECNCNCKCDCPKVECHTDTTAGPVVCMPMTCDADHGCSLRGGVNANIGDPFYTESASKYYQNMKPAAATHHR